jgi:hypothetical protein
MKRGWSNSDTQCYNTIYTKRHRTHRTDIRAPRAPRASRASLPPSNSSSQTFALTKKALELLERSLSAGNSKEMTSPFTPEAHRPKVVDARNAMLERVHPGPARSHLYRRIERATCITPTYLLIPCPTFLLWLTMLCDIF